jgi:hypothetical protein
MTWEAEKLLPLSGASPAFCLLFWTAERQSANKWLKSVGWGINFVIFSHEKKMITT